MGLIGNCSTLHKAAGAFFTSGSGLSSTNAGNFHASGRSRNRTFFFNKKASFPDGYDYAYALKPAQKAGGLASQTNIAGAGAISDAQLISARLATATLAGAGAISVAQLSAVVTASATLAGAGALSGGVIAGASMTATLAGVGAISNAAMAATIPISGTLAGIGAFTANLKGIGRLEAEITPFTELSPQSLAENLLDAQDVEAGYSMREALRLILSAVAGKLSGAGTATITIRNVPDSKDRIVATVDVNGNREAVTYDVGD